MDYVTLTGYGNPFITVGILGQSAIQGRDPRDVSREWNEAVSGAVTGTAVGRKVADVATLGIAGLEERYQSQKQEEYAEAAAAEAREAQRMADIEAARSAYANLRGSRRAARESDLAGYYLSQAQYRQQLSDYKKMYGN